MFKIQTLPAEALLTNDWTTVDEIANLSEFLQYIQSPSFYWYDNLLVRCVEASYVGVFRDDHVVNLSYDSKIKRKHTFGFSPQSRYFESTLDYPSMWRLCPSAVWMLYGPKKFSDDRMKEIVLRVYDQLAKLFPEVDISSVAWAVELFRNGVRPSVTRRAMVGPEYHFSLFIERLIGNDNPSALGNLGMAYGLILNDPNSDEIDDDVQRVMADFVREIVPFTEVLKIIT